MLIPGSIHSVDRDTARLQLVPHVLGFKPYPPLSMSIWQKRGSQPLCQVNHRIVNGFQGFLVVVVKEVVAHFPFRFGFIITSICRVCCSKYKPLDRSRPICGGNSNSNKNSEICTLNIKQTLS